MKSRVDYKKKCKTCAKIDLKTMMCKELNAKCSKCFMKCSDKRVACKLCSNWHQESSSCCVDGQFKDELSFRYCKSFNEV